MLQRHTQLQTQKSNSFPLKDEKLMDYYKCHDITEMPQLVFPHADEFAYVSRQVMIALGLAEGASEDETLEAAKN